MQGPDLLGIAEKVVRGIHRIDGVERTMTAPVVPAEVFTTPGEGSRAPVPMQGDEDAGCFVHVRTSSGSVSRLVETISEIEEVSAVAMIAGEYDLLVEIPLAWEQAAPVIVNRLLPLDGVEETRTLVALRFATPDEEDRDQFSAWS